MILSQLFLFFSLHFISSRAQGPNPVLDNQEALAMDLASELDSGNYVSDELRPEFFLPEGIVAPTPLQISLDMLSDVLRDRRLRVVSPTSPEQKGYEIDCSSGKLPPQKLFPPGRFRSRYKSLTELCSIYTSNTLPHLGCQCRNPGLGEWVICYGEPHGDGLLSTDTFTMRTSNEPTSIIDACYKHCKCKQKKPPIFRLPSEESVSWTPLNVRDWPDTGGSSDSLSSMSSPAAYTITKAKQGINIIISQRIAYLPSSEVVARLDAAGVAPPGGWACVMSGGFNGTCPPAQLRLKPGFKKQIDSGDGTCPVPISFPPPSSSSPSSPSEDPIPEVPGVPAELQPDNLPECRATCDVARRFSCGSGCKCIASRLAGGLSHVAGCMTILGVKRLIGGMGGSSRVGLDDLARNRRLTYGYGGRKMKGRRRRMVEEEEEENDADARQQMGELVEWGCPCNTSYVSRGCCDSESGLVWEQKHEGMGALKL